MSIYGQFCPASKAVEVLGERWTLLLIRELLMGSNRFNELQRGLAKMSPSLLTKRLKELEKAGLLTRTKISGQKGYEYHLTSSGRELSPLMTELAKWGMRWVSDSLHEDELDVELLMWELQRNIKHQSMPISKALVKFHFNELREHKDWWIVVNNSSVDLCTESPGYEADLYINSSVHDLIKIWMGDISWEKAINNGQMVIRGNTLLEKTLPQWLGKSKLSSFNPRCADIIPSETI